MTDTFETFKPKLPLIAQYVDYYYLDIKPDNDVTEFDCFPHYNNTISIYQSHRRASNRDMIYDSSAAPFQIFTPIREKVLKVRQIGKVHRIVLVFHALGIQQFYRNINFADYIMDFPFFSDTELRALFATREPDNIRELLDNFLLERYQAYRKENIESAIQHIFSHYEEFSVERLALQLGISRRHLNRLFKTHFGVSIKKFHRIILLRKLLELKLFDMPKESFTRLAYELNYADQAHLNKAFKDLTQNSPNQFLKKGTLLGNEDTFWHIVK